MIEERRVSNPTIILKPKVYYKLRQSIYNLKEKHKV